MRLRHPELPVAVAPELGPRIEPDKHAVDVEKLEVLDVLECDWFSNMVVLIFGFAFVLIGSCVYNFPAAPVNNINSLNTDQLEQPDALGLIIGQHVILFSLCSIVVIAFASVCLAIRIKGLSSSPSFTQWRYSSANWPPLIQRSLWGFLLLFLIIFMVVLDWFILDGLGARYYRAYLTS